jgi:catechol 2,3-dioxygenase-like lactoylglutathione lyase family enzyme
LPITHVFAGIPTSDFATALPWYERLLGMPPTSFPHDAEAVWQLTETALIYVVADRDRAGDGLLTLIVDDIERWVEEASGRGVEVGAIETLPGKVRRTAFADADGNTITIGQPLSSAS